MQHFKFSNDFMKQLFSKISLENKRSSIVGNFNLNLIKYRQITGVNQFLESMLTNNFIPQITLQTRIDQKSATFIHNIFLNYHEHQCISGNFLTEMMTKLKIGIITTLTKILLKETLMKKTGL